MGAKCLRIIILKDFSYCDSGMIPWLKLVEIMGLERKPLSGLVRERMLLYPVSGEINRVVNDPARVMESIEQRYAGDACGLTERTA